MPDNNPIKKVLVIGGAGFIGLHVVHELHEKGIPVAVFDSFVTGSRERVPEGVAIIEGDIRDSDALEHALSDVSHVVHLAALVSVTESMENPLATHDINSTGFVNVLEAARKAGVERVVYASSAAVYGDHPQLPKQENLPFAPRSPYALSKIVNELAARLYADTYNLSTIGLRFFNVYGRGQKGDHPYASVIPRFIEAIKSDRPIEIYGDGNQTRDFVHVRDVASAAVAALHAREDSSRVFNVASGTELSLNELVDLIRTHAGKEIVVIHHPARPGDIQRSVADVGLINHKLGFSTTVPLEEGIRELIEETS